MRPESEMEILKFGGKREELYSIQPMMTKDEVIAIQDEIRKKVYLSDKVLDYVLNIVAAIAFVLLPALFGAWGAFTCWFGERLLKDE